MQNYLSESERKRELAYEWLATAWSRTKWGKRLTTSCYDVTSEKIPAAFDGFCIVQISDLHGRRFGKEQKTLLRYIRALKPDVIFMTGDMMQALYEEDERSAVLELYRGLPKIAPTFVILGNHETRSCFLPQILADLVVSEVHLLRDERVYLQRGTDRVMLYGLETGKSCRFHINHDDQLRVRSLVGKAFKASPEYFRILLAHKPEDFSVYQACGADLTFSGHAHGGLTGIGPFRLMAPGQGFFPRYTQGKYSEGSSEMIVSAGLGGPRVLIGPEVVCAHLHAVRKEE